MVENVTKRKGNDNMKKLIIFMIVVALVIGVDSCRDKRSGNSDDEIYVAKDYATAVFEDTMPEEYTIVSAKGSIGEARKDSVYEITLTYTIGDEEEKHSQWYKVSVEKDGCTILEEKTVE